MPYLFSSASSANSSSSSSFSIARSLALYVSKLISIAHSAIVSLTVFLILSQYRVILPSVFKPSIKMKDKNAKKVIKSMFKNVADGKDVVVTFQN